MSSKKKVHIIGIGNLTRLDDGVAINVINQLMKKIHHKEVKITDLGTGGLDIALMLDEWEYGIIIDAVKIEGKKPGSIIELDIKEEQMPEIKGLSSTHGFDALTSLKLAYKIDTIKLPKEIKLLGIQISNMDGFGIKLSNSVKKAIPKVISRILELINFYLGN